MTNPLGSYRPRLPLMQHQIDAISACDAKPPDPCPEDAFAYLMDMGTGKSATVLADFARQAMSGGPPDLLIVAPAGSYKNWFQDKGEDEENWSEFRKHLNPDFRERLVDVPWISGQKNKLKPRIEAMLKCRDKKRPRVLTINVEALSSVQAARDLCIEFVEQRGAMVVVDESTTIKNSGAERAKFLIQLSELALCKRIMSGLWAPRSPIDLFAQCQFLDERILRMSNVWAFKSRYAVMRNRMIRIPGQFNRDGSQKTRSFKEIVSYRHLEELQAKVAKYSYRVRAEDCLDLPPKTYMTRDVPLTSEQKKMIQEIKLFGHAAVGDSFVTVDMVIKQITRLIQINCGYVMDDERVLREVPENRTDALIEVLEDHADKAVIWCPWLAPLRKIVQRLQKKFGPESVAQWHGGNTRDRSDEERRFIGDKHCTFMVATQGAGMRGNTWTVANLVCYYANNYDLEQRDQSERRTWRKGQRRSVRYMDFLAEGTIDWTIVRSLRKKIDISTMMNQEELREWLI